MVEESVIKLQAEDGDDVAPQRKRAKTEASEQLKKFTRGQPIATRKITDRKLKGTLRYQEHLFSNAARRAAKADEWLLPSAPGALEAEGLERTWQFQQRDIVQEVEVGAARKVFDLRLEELGPYNLSFTRSGRHLLLGGRKGHLALLDWQRASIVTELQVRETIHDVQFLHNHQFFAAAQKKYVYIYDQRGIEVHCLKEHTEVRRLEFLPYHFLLCSIGESGVLRYQDTSTGQIVAQHRTKLGPCDAMRQNPWNAVLSLGHANGSVSMWTPNITTPVVRMLCHRGPVRALCIDQPGRHLVTSGADGQIKVWDVRTFKPLHAYFSHAPTDILDISQRGMLAVGHGRRVQVWQDALREKQQSPYVTHAVQGGLLRSAVFCPYEDVLAMGHSGGLSTALVPGAGEPNYDSMVADPFQGRKARREAEVHSLLDKLQPDMIVLDPTAIGQVRKEPRDVQLERQAEATAANQAQKRQQREEHDEKKKMKGKNKPTRRNRRKQLNIIEDSKPQIKARMREEGVTAEHGGRKAKNAEQPVEIAPDVPRALRAFYRK